MNILFFVFHGFSEYSGISKKIKGQVEGLRDAGHLVDVCHYDVFPDGHKCRMINADIIKDYGKGFLASIKSRIFYNAVYEYIISHNIQLVYIRSFNNANPFITQWVHSLMRHNTKVVMEVPTFPYDQEYNGFSLIERLELKIDQFFRKNLASELFRIVTFSNANTIFGAKTIKISNGIDFDSVPLKKTFRRDPSPINLIGVAEVHYWHAFDRVIIGIGEYYRKPHDIDIFFHVVGGIDENSDMLIFKKIIATYRIEKYIIFHGQQFGKILDELFEQADFAIGSLGRHRTGIDKIKTLKNREYAARGIPFIYSETDSDFDNKPYVLKASADESPIDMNRIIRFYRSSYFIPSEIRNTVKNLSWKSQMEIVVNTCFPQ
jgi:hypothetical protein